MKETITLELPDELARRARSAAAAGNRRVEDVALDWMARGADETSVESLPEDLSAAVAQLDLLDDDELWRAARGRLATEAAERLEALHLRRQRSGLSAADDRERDDLERQYERALLVRARAAAVLRRRGHDVSGLLAAP